VVKTLPWEMKPFLTSLFLLVSVLLAAQQPKGDSWAKIKSSGAGTLAVLYYEQPGLIAKMPDGEIKGVCVDILLDFQKYVETKYGKRINIYMWVRKMNFPGF
jgi:hypothetical protein